MLLCRRIFVELMLLAAVIEISKAIIYHLSLMVYILSINDLISI